MSKANLMELCTSPNKGGLELYFANISNVLEPHFNLVNVVSSDSQVSGILEDNRPVLVLDKIAHYLPVISAWKLARMIDEHKVDVLHMHWNKDLTVAVLAKLLSKSKPKLVITRHMQFPSRKSSFFHRFLYKNVDHIIAITETMKKDLQRFIPEDVQPAFSVNYLGIEPITQVSEAEVRERRKAYDPEEKLFLIALVGRIDFYKGHDLLVDAMAEAKKRGLPFKALIVGHAMEESYLRKLKKRISQLNLDESIVFTGFVDNPRALMQACDTVILATIEETFGLVLIEAMSIGVPVIGSDRGGVPEIIAHERTGLLFESGSSEKLFASLNRYYQHPEQAKAYAKSALAEVQVKFSAIGHKERLVTCLEMLAGDNDE